MEQEKKLKSQSSIKRTNLTPDEIMNTLFQMHSVAHYYHLQTTSFAQHKMLDDLYEALEDHKDAICEYLLGIQAPKRFGALVPGKGTIFSPANLDMFLQDGYDFSVSLCEYAESLELEQLCNLASDMQGTFAKSKYLNTLK